MKIRPVGAELFHADRQTDGNDEADSRFRNFANAPKNDACPLKLSHLGHHFPCPVKQVTMHESFKKQSAEVGRDKRRLSFRFSS